MTARLTNAQRKLLEHVAANSGRLYDYASRRDFPVAVARRDVIHRACRDGLIDAPSGTQTRTYELTAIGRAALGDAP